MHEKALEIICEKANQSAKLILVYFVELALERVQIEML
jgi:hypothetical protein